MQTPQPSKDHGFFSQEKTLFWIAFGLLAAMGSSAELWLRKDFGVRYLRVIFGSTVCGLGIWLSLLPSSTPGGVSFSLYLFLYCAGALYYLLTHTVRARWQEWRGTATKHSRYQGTSWAFLYTITRRNERLIQQWIEPGIILALGLTLGYIPELTVTVYQGIAQGIWELIKDAPQRDPALYWLSQQLGAVTTIDTKAAYWFQLCAVGLFVKETIAWRNSRERDMDFKDATFMAASSAHVIGAEPPASRLRPTTATRATKGKGWF